jgi:hypothetical protein
VKNEKKSSKIKRKNYPFSILDVLCCDCAEEVPLINWGGPGPRVLIQQVIGAISTHKGTVDDLETAQPLHVKSERKQWDFKPVQGNVLQPIFALYYLRSSGA